MLVKLTHFYIIEPQRSIGGLICVGGGEGVDYDIEHCHFFNYFLPNLQLSIGKKYLNTAKTRGTAGRKSPALIHKWNNLTVCYAGLIPPASPSL
jgi:hypothetical protein